MKHCIWSILASLAFLLIAPTAQAYYRPIACVITATHLQAKVPIDTLRFKGKITYGDKKIKNPKEFNAVLETAQDAETMRLYKKFKSTSTIAGVFFILGVIIGIALIIVSRGQLRKVIQRFNDVKMGRATPSVSFQQPDHSTLNGEG